MQREIARIVLVVGILAVSGCIDEGTPADLDGTSTAADDLQLTFTHRIKNALYGGCIEAPNNGLNVILNIGGNCLSQQAPNTLTWLIEDSGIGPVRIANEYSPSQSYCIEVNNGSQIAGERVDEFYCSNNQSELWIEESVLLKHVSYVRYHPTSDPSMCLDTVGGAGSQLMQWPCDFQKKNMAQMWVVE